MELGSHANFKETRLKIKAVPSPVLSDGPFEYLASELTEAVEVPTAYQTRAKSGKGNAKARKGPEALNKAVKSPLAVDSYNRYSLSVHSASPDVYGILHTAGIAEEFSTLLRVVMPEPSNQEKLISHMAPLELLGAESDHTAWMPRWIASGSTL
jgi:hypothetical protein